jgi:hypothetical protein
MRTTVTVKALILVPLVVFTVLLVFFALGYLARRGRFFALLRAAAMSPRESTAC